MNIAIIFAGGVGKRMHTKQKPKQFLEMNSKPIIIHTLEHFQNNDEVDAIVVVCVKEWILYLKELLLKYRINKVVNVVPGGTTGQMSIFSGLTVAKQIAPLDDTIVLIHDGVRPLINSELISMNIQSVKQHGSAITTSKVNETILVVNETKSEIDYVPERNKSRVAKAPQSFFLKDIYDTHIKAQNDGLIEFIDSCTLMQFYGYEMYLVDGPQDNIKITTPEDFYIMRAIIEANENAQIYQIDGK